MLLLKWILNYFNRYYCFVGVEGRNFWFFFKWITVSVGIQPLSVFDFTGTPKAKSSDWEFWKHLQWCESKLKGDNIWILSEIYVFWVDVYITSPKKESSLGNKTEL